MQIPAVTGPVARTTPGQPRAWGSSDWEAFPGKGELPVTSSNLRYIRKERIGSLSISVTALVAVSAVAAAYLLLRCAVYLANASNSIAALRFLSGAEGATNEYRGEHCHAPADDPFAAASPAEGKEEEETLVKADLLERAHRYVSRVTKFIKENEWLLLQLSFDLRAKCVAEFLCLCVMEFSALLSLLEPRERAGMKETISKISSSAASLRRSLKNAGISRSRQRHIGNIHNLVDRLAEVKYTAAALVERERLLRISELLNLQETALRQLNDGLLWLRRYAKLTRKANDVEAAGAAVGSASVTNEAKIAAIVKAMEATVHKRRDQILQDPLLSQWIRELADGSNHHGIMRRARLDEKTQQPRQTHRELVESLQATPLGSGDKPWECVYVQGVTSQQGSASSSIAEAPTRGGKVSPSESPTLAPQETGPQMFFHQRPRNGGEAVGSVPASVSPSTPTAAPATATGGAAGRQAFVQARSNRKAMSSFAASNGLPQVSPPGSIARPQVAAMHAAPQSAAIPLIRGREPHIPKASTLPHSTFIGRSSSSSPSEAKSMPLPTSFTPLVSTSSSYTPETVNFWAPGAPGRTTQTLIDPDASSRSWASVVELGFLSGSAVSRASPGTAALSQSGFDRTPGASRPRRGTPLVSIPQPHDTRTRPRPSAKAAGSLAFEADKDPLRGAEKIVSRPLPSPLQPPVSQPLRIASCGPLGSCSSPKAAEPEVPAGIRGWSPTFKVTKTLGRGPPVPAAEVFPNNEPDKPSHPDIVAGFEELAKLFGRKQQQLKAANRRHRTAASPAADTVAGAVESAAAAHSSPTSTEPGAESS